MGLNDRRNFTEICDGDLDDEEWDCATDVEEEQASTGDGGEF